MKTFTLIKVKSMRKEIKKEKMNKTIFLNNEISWYH